MAAGLVMAGAIKAPEDDAELVRRVQVESANRPTDLAWTSFHKSER